MNVVATPQIGTPFRFNVLPDTGCEQTVISQDLVTANGMVVDTNLKKRLRAANGAPMECSGSVILRVAFQGAETDVLALATSSLQEEVLLSWKALQRLGIISKDFPNRISKVKAVSTAPRERLQQLMEEYASVFEVGKELKTMEGGSMHINSPKKVSGHFADFLYKTAFLKSKFEDDPVRVQRHNVPHFKDLE